MNKIINQITNKSTLMTKVGRYIDYIGRYVDDIGK